MIKNCEVEYDIEKQRYNIVVSLEDGKQSATYITLEGFNDVPYMSEFLKGLVMLHAKT